MTTFQMTLLQIKWAERHMPHRCPVALCLRDATGERWNVCGIGEGLKGYVRPRDRKGESIPLPPHVQQFAVDFDAGRTVEPITFELPIPPKEDTPNP